MLAITMAAPMADDSALGWTFFAVGLLVVLPLLVGAGIRRLHDQDRSGWWTLLFYGVLPLVSVLAAPSGSPAMFGLLSVVSAPLTIWGLVWLGFRRGTVGRNRFGPDPLQE